MPECEICGRRVDAVYEINVEGAQMLVCEDCARGKEVVHEFVPDKGRTAGKEHVRAGVSEEELVENFGEVIRNAREKLGFPIKVLAERIAEKESTLLRIERQKTLPSEKTRKKLEKELGIKLLVISDLKSTFVASRKSEPVTLGDLVKKKDEKGEE